MACLLCGNSVGVVRRFRDPDFCSDEHRREWVQGRERVLTDRLLESRIRIERARDRYRSRKPMPDITREPSAAEFFSQAPGDICGEVLPAMAETGYQAGAKPCAPFWPVTPVPAAASAGFKVDLPWPAWNAGLRTFGDLGMEALTSSPELDFSRAAARVFGSWKPREIHLDVPLGRLAYVRRPDLMGRRATPFLLAEFAPPHERRNRPGKVRLMKCDPRDDVSIRPPERDLGTPEGFAFQALNL